MRLKNRLSKVEYFLEIANLVAKRSTCVRRQVGCVLVNPKNHIVATGYNGLPAGFPHCIDCPCPGVQYASGEGYGECQAIHAEINALLQVQDKVSLFTAYLTTTPCFDCTKVLCNTNVKTILTDNLHSTYDSDDRIKQFLYTANIQTCIYDYNTKSLTRCI